MAGCTLLVQPHHLSTLRAFTLLHAIHAPVTLKNKSSSQVNYRRPWSVSCLLASLQPANPSPGAPSTAHRLHSKTLQHLVSPLTPAVEVVEIF
ncbi:hypothetical protein E2C01_045313 [Portunus trituberculatus]|uniref:Uncharacterized protein n=1 Tax=Portunus trituberculatus TaxID=210409 RepID=A0A5B7G1P7_PORTR|nr:hypothetical protein [Portunus trituberculatus]